MTKKIVLTTAALVPSLIFAQPLVSTFENLNVMKKNNLKVEKVLEENGVYMIDATRDGKHFTVFVARDLKTAFFGRAYDSQTGEMLQIPRDMTVYKKDAHFTYGSGKKHYYVFTDPECPYCVKFEKQLLEKKNLEKDVTIHFFLFPLHFHKNATKMSQYILSKHDSKKAMDDIMMNSSLQYKKEVLTSDILKLVNEKINRSKQLASELSVTGTPTVLDENGKKISWGSF